MSTGDLPLHSLQAPLCGATVQSDQRAVFRIWAPRARRVCVVLEHSREAIELAPQGDGYFSGQLSHAPPGSLYRVRLDDGQLLPDPYSRFQPSGPHGPSMIVDPGAFLWHDDAWAGLNAKTQVIYELHVGTFTAQGTFAGVAAQLAGLRELGITCLELMPIAEFAGDRGWGYDGVDFFAPYHRYGDPDSLRRLVDEAHGMGLGVILDVVYNHNGADGNYLPEFSEDYFTDEHASEWGKTFNYSLEPVRRLAIDNAAYWIREYHLDGLRLDATQSIFDPDYPRLFARLTQACRVAAGKRAVLICGEDYLQRSRLLTPAQAGGGGFDCLWNDDFHHSARVALTGSRDGYFGQYGGSAQELLTTLKRGFLFQGQLDTWRRAPRGSSTAGKHPSAFIAFIQNHDQVANTLYGERIHTLTSPGRLRAMTATLLLGSATPLLFMGQEYAADSAFAYFADYPAEVAGELWASRRKALQGFAQYAGQEAQERIPNPCDPWTFANSVLQRDSSPRHLQSHTLHRDLLTQRRERHILDSAVGFDGAVLNDSAFVARWFGRDEDDRLLLVNLGPALAPGALAEPLLAPLPGKRWRLLWSSNDLAYGGMGATHPLQHGTLRLPAEVACFLGLEPDGPDMEARDAAADAELD